MLIEDFYKRLLKDKHMYDGLRYYLKVHPSEIILIDITGLKRVDPYKEIGIASNKSYEGDQDFLNISTPTVFKVNPGHNIIPELPFDTCLIKWSETDLTNEEMLKLDPGFNKGEVYFLMHGVEGSTETMVMAFGYLPTLDLIAEFKIFVLNTKDYALMFAPKDAPIKDKLIKDQENKKNAMLLELIIQCIATLKKCNKRETNLYTTTPAKGKGVKINGKFTDISDKPIYIYTERNVNEKKAQIFTRGNPVEHCICWPVRGHWRRLDDPKKRGKDIHGNYVIEGMTWVKPTVKGNKDMPLRQRTYIAKEASNGRHNNVH